MPCFSQASSDKEGTGSPKDAYISMVEDNMGGLEYIMEHPRHYSESKVVPIFICNCSQFETFLFFYHLDCNLQVRTTRDGSKTKRKTS